MQLSALSFSDLLLLPDGTALLKGCPASEEQLVPVPSECLPEVESLRLAVSNAFLGKGRLHADGIKELPSTIRYTHEQVCYRVADIQDVTKGQTWFLRRLADKVPSLSDLGIPPFLFSWLLAKEQRQGLILLSGGQASGKTTTASALIKDRLVLHGGHAVTFENPAELPLAGPWDAHGYCFQTEIPGEYELAAQIERAHRYASPNIIFIGEIRSKFAAVEALRVALGSSRQMVIATIHGLNVVAALDRLINWARELDGENALQNLSNSLLGIIQQELPSENGKRVLRVPQFLLVPFHDDFMPIRAKLRDGRFEFLGDDMRAQKNNLIYNRGLDGKA